MAFHRSQSGARILLTCVVLTLIAAAVLWPMVTIAAAVGGSVLQGGDSFGVDVRLLAASFGVAALIAILATALALPAAWAVRAARGGWLTLLMGPMLLPAYLAYTGWGIIRAPDTAIGKWLMLGPRGAGPDASNWYPTAAGHILAVGGLALWAWPLAALVIGLRLRRVDDAVMDSLQLELQSAWRRWAEVMWMCRASVAAATGIVMLVMLGSAIPLHLAQLDTYAIRLWRILDQTSRDNQGKVWTAAWPLILIAICAAAAISRRIRGMDSDDHAPSRHRTSLPMRMTTLLVWCLSLAVPVALLAANIRDWHSCGTFWTLIRAPLATSAGIATTVGAAIALLTAWVWMTLGTGSKKLTFFVAAALLTAGLIPGILIGAATARAWSGSQVGDSEAVVILVHIARFGLVAVVGGWWLAATEGRWLRDLRQLDVGNSVCGWIATSMLPRIGILGSMGVTGALLSFQEIESTVLVQPASSSGGSFAWQMLQWLHFARMDELGMGVLIVAVVGVTAGCIVAACNWAASPTH